MLTETLKSVRQASRDLPRLDPNQVDGVLYALAQMLRVKQDLILAANAKDMARMDKTDPKYDRLLLDKARIEAIATDLEQVAKLPFPLQRVLEERTLKNGLVLKKVSVPLGVVGVIYEARPNVTFDVFSLCFKSGNACVLKGGSDAYESNQAAVGLIQAVLKQAGINSACLFLVSPEREALTEFLEARQYIDVLIPRGSQELINFVREHSKIPVIETGAGIVHTFIDETAEVEMARNIVENAKTRRVSVCNALDTLLIHERRLNDLPRICEPLANKGVEIFADHKSFYALKDHYPLDLLHPAGPEHFGCEFLALKLSIKTMADLEEALAHIGTYGSKHSEAILTRDEANAQRFLQTVDAAVVYVNTSTAFTDGAQFGLGAEIGISTQKLHARGPMGLKELTSYKWLVYGSGQVRPA